MSDREWYECKCGERFNTLEIPEIYDGWCAKFCTNCKYYEVRDGERFQRHEGMIVKTVLQILEGQSNDTKN